MQLRDRGRALQWCVDRVPDTPLGQRLLLEWGLAQTATATQYGAPRSRLARLRTHMYALFAACAANNRDAGIAAVRRRLLAYVDRLSTFEGADQHSREGVRQI
jgi:hypothetical protein